MFKLKLVSAFEAKLLNSYPLTKKFISYIPPSILEKLSEIKAYEMYKLAKENVPAYKKFLRQKKPKSIIEVPQTDKKNYISKFNYEDRCQDGKFPKKGNVDESSGSSGTPTNWIRGVEEEDLLFKAAKFEFYYTFNAHKIDYITLSAWSSGPWATGVKFCELLEHYTLVKNTTPDIKNIIKSLKTFGKKYNYIIGGYPPFLKQLFDARGVKWKDYNINIITGGESTPIEWKEHIRHKLRDNAIIISSYGASDLDIGIGFETPFSEFIRVLTKKDPKLNKELFKTDFNPMLFQFNPLMHYIENTNKKDFTVTTLDPTVASPKVKYNIHDEGGKVTYSHMLKVLKKEKPKELKKFLKKNKTLKLPFLYVLSRCDGTISLDGANIYPEQIEIAIDSNQKTAKETNRFMMQKRYKKNEDVEFNIFIELKAKIKPTKELEKTFKNTIRKGLIKLNKDYKESYEKNKKLAPNIKFYQYNKNDIFKKQNKRIKNKYIL